MIRLLHLTGIWIGAQARTGKKHAERERSELALEAQLSRPRSGTVYIPARGWLSDARLAGFVWRPPA